MDFYTTLGEYYDWIFPLGQRQVEFFQALFKQYGISSVLDVACGTGNYTLQFAQWGVQSVGIDLNEQMILQARQKAETTSLPVAFSVADMTQLPSFNQPFEAIICIGNSLVHLLTTEAILQALQGFAEQLRGQGLIVIQIVNYDRIIDQQLKGLPTIERPELDLRFERHYLWRADGLIEFRSLLSVGKQEMTDSVLLLPLRRQELETLLGQAGFELLNVYGGFQMNQPSEQSQALVVVARKSK